MRKSAISTLAMAGTMALTMTSFSMVPGVAGASAVDDGRKIVSDRKKGNCMACHKIGDLKGRARESHGNIGPALVNMKARYPDKAKLRDKIHDATATVPNSIMPPFGKHKILTKDEVDKVVEFIYTL